MIASVHVADVGARSMARVLRAPKPSEAPGLRQADVAVLTPLRRSALPALQPSRVGLIAFWDDDEALDAFLADHPTARSMADGWRLRLAPLRAWGSWPGLPPDTPTDRSVDHEGPAAVLTLARTRMSQIVRFLRTSAPAERAALEADGMIWGTAMALPPFFATCSLWESTKALSVYAYGRRQPAHTEAIEVDRAKPFHHTSAFIRFRPYRSEGELTGRNALSADWLTSVGASA